MSSGAILRRDLVLRIDVMYSIGANEVSNFVYAYRSTRLLIDLPDRLTHMTASQARRPVRWEKNYR